MTLTITTNIENTASRHGSSSQSTRAYTIAGNNAGTPMTEDELSTYINGEIGSSIPTTVCGYKISDASYAENVEIPGQFEVTVNWDTPTEALYRFTFQAQGGHFVQSLKTISAWGDASRSATTQPLDLSGNGFPNFQGAIGVVLQEDGPPRIEGVDVQPPPETFSLGYHTDDTVVTGAYQALISNLCGKVNSATFRDLPAGSTMLVRANGEAKRSPTGHTWVLEFGFGYIANVDGGTDPIIIGDGNDSSLSKKIVVTNKDGLDLLWLFREQTKTASGDGYGDTYNLVRPMPKVAYVERVWPRADLNSLGLPA
jgi:hypothetical protein